MKCSFIISFTIHILIFTLAIYMFVPTAKYKTVLNTSPIDVEILKFGDRKSKFRKIVIGQKGNYELRLSKELTKPQINSLIDFNPYHEHIKEMINELNISPKAKMPETPSLILMPAFSLSANLFDIYEPTIRYKLKIMRRDASRSIVPRNIISQDFKPPSDSIKPESKLVVASVSKTPEKFADIFLDLAQCISERVFNNKIYVIFVIDITADMQINVHEVGDNIHLFIEKLKEKSIDTTLGLVEFTDEQIRKPTVFGSTKNFYEFKKWLDKTKTLSGGDLPESGYDALMVALKKTKQREAIQRSLVINSNASQHDIYIDGKTVNCLDEVIGRLNRDKVYVVVIGPDYLPMIQLSWGTYGKWWKIPHGFPVI
ncbi:MAG: molecular chaperone DnaK [Candidatus Poribacteria bacterium]|nr:molecular chaperone DnaK [Candidatus Poribacteria bacterium]